MKKRKTLPLLLASVMLLASCGKGSSSQSSDSGTEQSSLSSEESGAENRNVDMLDIKPSQVINKEPATFESLGADKEAVKAFEQEQAGEHTIPSIHIVTAPGDEVVSIYDYTSCVVDTFNCDESLKLDGVSAGVKVRGNSSAFYGDVAQIRKNQVPYRIKFDKKTNMLGLHDGAEAKSWVLLKADWDLIRNDIAFRFGRTLIGGHTFSTDSQIVYVYLNNEFKGIYTLCEQCQVGKNRVNVTQPDEGYTGNDIGYYLELDNYATSEDDNIYITLDYGEYEVTDIEGETRKFVPAEYTIKNDVYTKEQILFIDKYMNNVFRIIYEACENGAYYTFDENYGLVEADFASAEETVEAVADVQSIVDMYLLYEIVHDYDCGEGSFYMCIDFAKDSKVPKLQFTSPWDFNWAYNDSTERYWAGTFSEKSFVRQSGDRTNPWFVVLAKQDWFMDKAKDKWTALQADSRIWGCIDTERDILKTYDKDLNKTEEWATGSAEQLLDWIDRRVKWMDKTYTNAE